MRKKKKMRDGKKRRGFADVGTGARLFKDKLAISRNTAKRNKRNVKISSYPDHLMLQSFFLLCRAFNHSYAVFNIG